MYAIHCPTWRSNIIDPGQLGVEVRLVAGRELQLRGRDQAPTVKGPLGPIDGHWRPLAAVGGGFLHKIQRRSGTMMSRKYMAVVKKNPSAAINGHWSRWGLVVTSWRKYHTSGALLAGLGLLYQKEKNREQKYRPELSFVFFSGKAE